MKQINFIYIFIVLLALFSGIPNASASLKQQGMIKIIRLYSDKNGTSHFQIKRVPTGNKIIPILNIFTTNVFPADGYIISTFNNHFFWDWHIPPQGGQYLDVILKGRERIDASDGTSKILNAGDILLLEDNSGKGHRAYGLSDGMELTIKLKHGLM